MTTKFNLVAALLLGALALGSCKDGCTDPLAINYDDKAKKDDQSCKYDEPTWITGYINENTTWTADAIIELKGKVIVANGVTLTIEPGAIIKCHEGASTLATALVVERGGKIMAEGTASQPIIFTSILDNIQIGELSGTNLNETDKGKWGGLLVLGNAPISAGNGGDVAQIEGIPVTSSYGAFGGNDPADNSGVLSYISIRHSGVLIGAGNEINGLTLGGVGSGTTISNIEVIANADDGVEFFGGTVNATNILVGFQKDDGIDLDMSYDGTIDNFIVINGPESLAGLEIDGPESNVNPDGTFILTNGTIQSDAGVTPVTSIFKSKAQGEVTNVQFQNIDIRASYTNNCVDPKTDAYTYLTQASPKLTITSSSRDMVVVYTDSESDALETCPVESGADASAGDQIISTPNNGASATPFDGWTWLNINGKL